MNLKRMLYKSRAPLIITLIAVIAYVPFRYVSDKDSKILPSYALFLTLVAIIWYTLETRRLRQLSEIQARPYVFISLQPLETVPALLNLVVQNIGSSPAYNLKFKVNEKVLSPSGKSISEVNFIKKGLNCLAPNHKTQFLFFNLYGTKSENIIPTDITVTYGRHKSDNEPFSETFTLDPAEFWGRPRVNEKRYEGIEEMLKKIHEDLSHVSTGVPNSKLRVVAYTKEEAKKEEEDIIAECDDMAQSNRK
ncbi:hypothetical protein IMZ48_30780 [Candidatus Bathyarchaeota archaeon]|nr:hypothetical protein [Candidatus Bathyarchaeota archaeon]